MARCEGCNATSSMWDFKNCKHCNYPAYPANKQQGFARALHQEITSYVSRIQDADQSHPDIYEILEDFADKIAQLKGQWCGETK